MSLHEYVLLATGSLFVIIDPIATVPAFLAMTPTDTPAQRIRMARVACTISAVILLVFATTGKRIFTFFGITIPAFQIAGSIVLLLVALDMLRARRSAVQETAEETDAGAAKEDIAVTPLAVPMLAGPGAITTAVLLHNRAAGNFTLQVALCVCIVGVCLASFLIFALSAHGAKWLNPIFLRLTSRIMGLLLAAIAMQFLINALTDLKLLTLPAESLQ
ncbi:MAG TPA: MarC family protein [Haliangiales bacterium]|nr:MarC family protein [Haliangiales bacterium]